MIRNTWGIIGLVVYVGKDTKLMKNTQNRIYKMSSVESLMNIYIFMIICFFVICLIFLATYSLIKRESFDFGKVVLEYDLDNVRYWFYTSLGYLLLLNTLLPISLIISLQLLKLFQNA